MSRIIVFDANPLVTDQKTGVGMYTQRLIESISNSVTDDTKLVGYYYNFLGRKKPILPRNNTITYKQIRLYPGALVNLLRRIGIEIPIEFLVKQKADVVLFPNFLTHPSIFKSKKYAVLHDLSYITYPEFASEKNRKDLEKFVPKSLDRCNGVITVSEFSKSTIISTFGYDANDILVTPIPPEENKEYKLTKKMVRDLGVKNKYILFLGTLEPRKNLIQLLNAYESDSFIHNNYSLVMAGRMDWKFEQIAHKIESLKNNGLSVVHCGYVSDEQKAALYKHSSLYVLPSVYEGFGMPILEAMQHNIPVAVSNIPVFHEVASDAAIYFDQNSFDDIAQTIEKILKNSELRKKLVDNGKENLKRFNWENVAESVLDFIN